jgi:uncharacterized membrane protein YidH (DUF202 family)
MSAGTSDSGLQNERTGLAWQRTLLSGLTCGVLVVRLLASVSVTLAVIIGLLALLGTAGLGWLAIRRFRLNHSALVVEQVAGDGRAPALLSVLVIVTALGALAYVTLV